MVDHALQYAGRGWRVFPCKPRGKTPLTKHGFKDATVAPEKIEQMWARCPDANIAIATGTASGLIVFDYDGEQGKAALTKLIMAQGGNMPTTLCVRTGRGWHLYYTLLPEDIDMRCSSGDGIDVRANGGYVLAPPSVHPNGAIYTWWLGSPGNPELGQFYAPENLPR